MRDRAERAEEEVVRLQEKLTTEGGMAQVTLELSDKREAEVARLKKGQSCSRCLKGPKINEYPS